MQNVTRHIALGFDKNYIIPIYTLLTSIFLNNSRLQLFFHVIASGLTQEEKDRLSAYVKENKAQIQFHKISEKQVAEDVVIPAGSHFTIATYYRLFFPALMPQAVDTLLYIDSDTVVNGSLEPLFTINLGNAPVAAVPDPHPEVRPELGITKPGQYFNAGVLLIDVKNWIEQRVTERAFDFIQKFPDKIKFVDQDVLNAVLVNQWKKLPKKYNVMLLDVVIQVPKKELLKESVIIHFTSPWKPWHCLTKNKLRSVYHYYLRLSPMRHAKSYIDFKWEYKTLLPFIRIRCKELYFDRGLHKIFPIKSWLEITNYNY